MEIGVLGPLVVEAAGVDVLPRRPKQRALLTILALHANDVVPVDVLVDALWGAEAPLSATNAIQGHVSALRRVLGADRIETRPPGYRLRLEPDELDLSRFERLVADARKEEDPRRRAEAAAAALSLFRGEPLVDVRYEPFAAAPVARIEELRLLAIEARVDAELELGTAEGLVPELRGLVDENPLRERLREQLMLALYRSGRQTEALETFHDLRRELAALGLDPGRDIRRLHVEILGQVPTLTAPHDPIVRLPADVDSFVGRSSDRRLLTSLLAEARLVTLTGVGGSGKTRLALRAARDVAPGFPGGVYFVELAPLVDPLRVLGAITQVLGVPDTGGSQFDSLVIRLSGSRTLLVVDNFEHVAPAALDISRLVAACPDLTVLVTSRVPLRLRGEHEVPVEPLGPADAVRLFEERARAADVRFRAAAHEAAIDAVCARLDRLPLAIELAAARAPTLPPALLLERLGTPLDVLVDGAVDLPARQRTLRDTIAWSHALLDEADRTLFRRLAVFRGGWTEEAARAVCDLGPDAAAALARLVDQSLVKRNGDRYELLETVREYAAERLAEAGEETVVERRHATYFVELAERVGPALRRTEPEEAAVFDALTLERDNLRAAHAWAAKVDEAGAGFRILSALWLWYWTWLGEALETARLLLDTPSGRRTTHERAGGLAVAAVLSWALGDEADTARYAAEAAADARACGNTDALVLALSVLPVSHRDDAAQAHAVFEEAKAVAAEAGDAWGYAFAAACDSTFSVIVGDAQRALDEGRDALARFRAIRADRQVFFAQLGVGFALLQLGELEQSRAILDETLTEFERILNWKLANMCAIGLGLNSRFSGDDAAALAYYERALAIAERAGDPSNVPLALEGIAAASAAEDPARAAKLLGAARAAYDAGRTPTLPGFEPLFEQTSEQLAAALGESFAPLFAEGRATSELAALRG
jgi:predicted ATPase/DNA-binding SARP family transcriptional activator